MLKLTKVLYIPKAVKKKNWVSMLVSKGATMGATQDKITIKKNGVCVILGARKGQNKSMMFYLREKRYSPEGQEALTNHPEEKMAAMMKNKNGVRSWD